MTQFNIHDQFIKKSILNHWKIDVFLSAEMFHNLFRTITLKIFAVTFPESQMLTIQSSEHHPKRISRVSADP